MQKSSRQLAVLASEDLKRLHASQPFWKGIKELQGNIKKKVSPLKLYKSASILGERFSILDCEWLLDVARNWDGKGPLPVPNKPWTKRPSMATWVKEGKHDPLHEHKFVESVGSRYHDPEFGGSEVRTVPGSPKIWHRRSVLKDEDGVRYLTITVRITADLSGKWLRAFAGDSLSWAEHQQPTKPNLRALAFEAMQRGGRPKRLSVNNHAAWLVQELKQTHGLELSLSRAKVFTREFLAK